MDQIALCCPHCNGSDEWHNFSTFHARPWNTGIVGIQRGGVDHKVSLYADNLLLYVSDPTKSPTAVLSLFSLLGPLLGYKINLHKTKLFPVNAEALDADYSDLPFKVETWQFTYLRIEITRKFKNLFKENFLPLQSQFRASLQQCSLLALTLAGCIRSVSLDFLDKVALKKNNNTGGRQSSPVSPDNSFQSQSSWSIYPIFFRSSFIIFNQY